MDISEEEAMLKRIDLLARELEVVKKHYSRSIQRKKQQQEQNASQIVSKTQPPPKASQATPPKSTKNSQQPVEVTAPVEVTKKLSCTNEQLAFIREHANTMTAKQIAKKLSHNNEYVSIWPQGVNLTIIGN